MPGNQFRPPLPETNPNVKKNDITEKRKRATPKKFRPATPKSTATCPPLPEVPPKPKNSTPSVLVREDIPWPSAGKMLGNLFEDRNWLLPKNYLANENKNESVTGATSPRPPLRRYPRWKNKPLAQKQRSAVGAQIALFSSPKRRKKTSNSRSHHQMCQSLKLKPEHD